ncbi:hypothetical protein FGO68_gene4703 [Halteria grandinella]|uniref:Uncharacterized protein n=1 Tax=Halteria grandinella TaxID=5974 RepID=A0A8J8NLD6_HALGN|nr:hypothetical protein FGO68_gene4703 [Halteria grandinella]
MASKYLNALVYSVGLYTLANPFIHYAKSHRTLTQVDTAISNGERLRLLYGNDPRATVLITGSSDGVGKLMALQLAKYGFNLMLVSRSGEKLEGVKWQCMELNPQGRVSTVAMDFANVDPTKEMKEVFTMFDKSSEGDKPQLRMLINNVGVMDGKKILENTPEELESLLRVNIFTQVFMTKYARSVMPSDKHNAFVHLSSFLSELPFPFFGTYAGTKVFNKVYGKLTYEAQNTNRPDTLIVNPAGIVTNMTKDHMRSSSYVPPEKVVHAIFRELGSREQYKEINGCKEHMMAAVSLGLTPRPLWGVVKTWMGQQKEYPKKQQ